MFSEKLTRPSRPWLLLALTVGLALAVALPLALAGDAEAKKKKKKKKTVFVQETRTFSNTGSISFGGTGTGPATPYPSTISSSFGPGSQIVDVNLTLNNFTTNSPDDVAVMVAHGQTNQGVMADVGGGAPGGAVNNITFTLDDEGPLALPDGPLLAGDLSYRPARYGADWPAPAPSALSVFDGENPSGTWELFVVDDGFGANAATFAGGWSLEITAMVPVRR